MRAIPKSAVVVRKARKRELEWLSGHQSEYSVPFNVPKNLWPEWPCFVMLKGKEIIGYHSFEFHEAKGRVHAWVGRTSMRTGFEGKGLGKTLVGKANALLHARDFETQHVWAHEPRAKKFWARTGYERVKGAQLQEKGNTLFRLNLSKQRARKRK